MKIFKKISFFLKIHLKNPSQHHRKFKMFPIDKMLIPYKNYRRNPLPDTKGKGQEKEPQSQKALSLKCLITK